MSAKHYSVIINAAPSINPELMTRFGQLRYQCFDANDPNVNMDHFRRTELDHFDRMDDTTCIMVIATENSRQELVSAMRLRPTTSDYELEMDSYRYLTEGVSLPKSSTIMEGSRWVGRSSRTPEGMVSTGMLMNALYRYCLTLGVKNIIGTISTKSEHWLGKRAASAQRESNPYYSQRDDLTIMISNIALDQTFLHAANHLLNQGLGHFDITELELATKKAA
ncbi:MAG: hypothetical protein EP312_09320 [Gammaproteobacteria bacterium]|nr:MAG: hypothetical protein EP312_09320 [Gammaproteobacteria bacterium]